MFSSIKARFNDMGTIRTLCARAEHHARQEGQGEPGAEHFLLAALDLPEDTAQRAFRAVGADAAGLPAAIERQYAEGLKMLGLDPALAASLAPPSPPARNLFDAAPSGQEVMRILAEQRAGHRPLLGAHVVAVVAGMQHGVAARALRLMGVDSEALRAAAVQIVEDHRGK